MKLESAKRPWALVTGSSRGLGRELALAFARAKYNIILHATGKNPEALAKTALYLESELKVLTVAIMGRLEDDATVVRLEEEAHAKAITVLVNNAAIYQRSTLAEHSHNFIRVMIEANLLAPILLSRSCLPTLRAKHGCIINVNSMAAKAPAKWETLYAATKGGLMAFSNSLKFEALPEVRVLDVYLGAMATEMQSDHAEFEKLIKPAGAAHAIFTAASACLYEPDVRVDSINLRRVRY